MEEIDLGYVICFGSLTLTLGQAWQGPAAILVQRVLIMLT